jgi:hypothetical protein
MCQVALVGFIKFIETDQKICVQTYFLVRKINEIDMY